MQNRDLITLACNNQRYSFVYDGINARFSMSIDNVQGVDAGLWKCEVMYTRMHEPQAEAAVTVRHLSVNRPFDSPRNTLS